MTDENEMVAWWRKPMHEKVPEHVYDEPDRGDEVMQNGMLRGVEETISYQDLLYLIDEASKEFEFKYGEKPKHVVISKCIMHLIRWAKPDNPLRISGLLSRMDDGSYRIGILIVLSSPKMEHLNEVEVL